LTNLWRPCPFFCRPPDFFFGINCDPSETRDNSSKLFGSH
jgi:hypothetical protein